MKDKLRVLSCEEIQQVNGGMLANVLGAAAGAVGGFYGTIIGSGNDLDVETLVLGTLGGAASGAINPIRGFASAASTIGGGIASGATVSFVQGVSRIKRR